MLYPEQGDDDDENARPLAESLLLAIADLLFCPDFTVQSHRRSTVVRALDLPPLGWEGFGPGLGVEVPLGRTPWGQGLLPKSRSGKGRVNGTAGEEPAGAWPCPLYPGV